MVTIAIYTVLGSMGALIIFGVFFCASGAKTTSAPLGLIFMGLSCGIFAHYFSPWATVIILSLYAMGCGIEWWQDRHPPC